MPRKPDRPPPAPGDNAATAIKDRAARIYGGIPDTFKQTHHGDFMAIVVTADEHFTATKAHKAMEAARAAHPHGIIHLIRIGSDAAFSHR